MARRRGKQRRRHFRYESEQVDYRRRKRRALLLRLGLVVAGVLGFAAFVFILFRVLDQVNAPPRPMK